MVWSSGTWKRIAISLHPDQVRWLSKALASIASDESLALTTAETIRLAVARADGVTPIRRIKLRTHCKAGHEYTEANTLTRTGDGGLREWRVCKKCDRDLRLRSSRKRAAKRAVEAAVRKAS